MLVGSAVTLKELLCGEIEPCMNFHVEKNRPEVSVDFSRGELLVMRQGKSCRRSGESSKVEATTTKI